MPQLPLRQVMLANKKRSESGAALIEFAFVLVPTFACTFLLITLAWVLYGWACVQEGVREGARVAVTCAPSTGNTLTATIQQTVQTYAFGFVTSSTPATVQFLDPANLSTPIASNVKVISGDIVKVTIQGLPVSSFAPSLIGGSGPLHVSASAADIMSCPVPTSQ